MITAKIQAIFIKTNIADFLLPFLPFPKTLCYIPLQAPHINGWAVSRADFKTTRQNGIYPYTCPAIITMLYSAPFWDYFPSTFQFKKACCFFLNNNNNKKLFNDNLYYPFCFKDCLLDLLIAISDFPQATALMFQDLLPKICAHYEHLSGLSVLDLQPWTLSACALYSLYRSALWRTLSTVTVLISGPGRASWLVS